MSRAGSRNLIQGMGAHAIRTAIAAHPVMLGKVVSYDPNKHKATISIDIGQKKPYQPPPCQIASPFWGNGYGDQAGPPPDSWAICIALNREGNTFAILGFLPNDEDLGFGVPSDGRKILDKSGSFVEWSANNGGEVNVSGATRANISGAQQANISSGETVGITAGTNATVSANQNANVTAGTEANTTAPAINLDGNVSIGGHNLPAGGANAVVRASDLDTALTEQMASVTSIMATFAAGLQPGSGVTGPTFIPVSATGSSKVSAG